jgi:hypothetical protein
MGVGKRIDVAMNQHPLSDHFRKVTVIPPFHIITHEIPDNDFLVAAR